MLTPLVWVEYDGMYFLTLNVTNVLFPFNTLDDLQKNMYLGDAFPTFPLLKSCNSL